MTTGCALSTLPLSRKFRVAMVLALVAATGCVERRFIIETNVPNAIVYVDDELIGAAPAHKSFDFYGNYNITIVHPGYQTFTKHLNVEAPWYDYPPLDFLVEAVWPFHVHDTRRYYFELLELSRPPVDDLIKNANDLRQRGYNLPTPEDPAPPKPPPSNPPVLPQPNPVLPQPNPVVPQPSPQPNNPIVPPAGPQTGSVVPPAGPGAGSLVPSVLPQVRYNSPSMQ
jgi:hypothetical protein